MHPLTVGSSRLVPVFVFAFYEDSVLSTLATFEPQLRTLWAQVLEAAHRDAGRKVEGRNDYNHIFVI